MELLSFLTCGSVDDGKSTLIGRMLYDSKAVQIDLLEAVQESSRRNGNEALDLSLLTDGLKAEREQGITIDVAYKYFSTKKRKYIIADTPGHVQYTRNMVTGASTAQVAVLLVDARKGILEQTRRHAYINALLALPYIVLAVNKMDMVQYSEDRYREISNEFEKLLESFPFPVQDVAMIPLSALTGENVVHLSQKMPWYQGPSLLDFLESVKVESEENLSPEGLRFPVQGIIRPRSAQFPDLRAYTGSLSGGLLRPGDKVRIYQALPNSRQAQESRVSKILLGERELEEAFSPMAVSLVLEDEIDISRGDLLISAEGPGPQSSQNCIADLCWMENKVLEAGDRYILQHNTRQVRASIREIIHRIDIQTLAPQRDLEKPEKYEIPKELALNDLARVSIQSQQELSFDPYEKNRRTGSFILIDPSSCATVAAGMLRGLAE